MQCVGGWGGALLCEEGGFSLNSLTSIVIVFIILPVRGYRSDPDGHVRNTEL